MLQIREAHDADMTAVQAVIRSVYDEYGWPWEPDAYHADLYALDASYWEVGDEFFLAEWEGRPAGTIALEAHACKLSEPEGLVRILGCDGSPERLYVHPEMRRKGVGSALLDHALKRARARGMHRLEIWSDELLGDSHRLYKSKGARLVGGRLCDDVNLSPEFGFVIEL